MELIFSYIADNDISQINVPRYGPDNNAACELNIPIYLASQNRKVVICLPDNLSIKLSYEYIKSLYPKIRVGYADTKNISYNLSTQINYVSQRYLKYKTLQYYKNNTKAENFADIIIMFNPNMNDDNNIFIVSAFKYANDNNMFLPKFTILNSDYPYKLTNNLLIFKNEIPKPKYFHVNQNSLFHVNKNIGEIVKSNYYASECNFLIYVPDIETAISVNNTLKVLISDCMILIICNDYNNTINTFENLYTVKTKKIIIAVNFDYFYFENMNIIINTSKSKQSKALSSKSEKEEDIKDISHLILDYVNCEISLAGLHFDSITDKFKNINLKNTVNLMKNLKLLMVSDDKLAISASGFFSQTLNLSPRKTSFIWKWILNEYPLYQGLIIVSLIDEILPLIEETSYSKWVDKNPLRTYLNMFKSFNLENNIHDIIPNYDKSNVLDCGIWASNNRLSHDKFLTIISGISKLYSSIFKAMRNVNTVIADFNVQDLINQAVPILTEIYQENILIIKNDSIIQPHDNVKYLLNKYSFKNILKDEKIIPLLLRPIKNNNKNISATKIIYIDNFVII